MVGREVNVTTPQIETSEGRERPTEHSRERLERELRVWNRVWNAVGVAAFVLLLVSYMKLVFG